MQPGEVIGRRFVIERLAGSGGMGTVYRALDRQTGGPVAVKVVHIQDLADAPRFVRESQVLAGMSHPGIVHYVAHGETSNFRWLAMEWLEGVSLGSRLESQRRLPTDQVVSIGRQVALALAAAHEREIIHRDVKPENLLLLEAGGLRVKVVDFGIARSVFENQSLTRTGWVVGTPAYMAPEQARAQRVLDGRTDVFSLGCVLWECLTGAAPYTADNAMATLLKILHEHPPPLSVLAPDEPAPLVALIERMMAKDATDRPTADEVAEKLAAVPEASSAPKSPRSSAPRARVMTSQFRGPEALIVVSAPGEEMSATELQQRRARAEETALPYDARVDVLLDGSVAAYLSGGDSPADLAARAARAALALRSALPDAVVVLSMREDLPEGARGQIEGAIDRSTRLLGDAVLASLFASSSGGAAPLAALRLDKSAADLLRGTFKVAADKKGYYVVE